MVEISQERHDQAAALFVRIRELAEKIKTAPTLREKVALCREQGTLIFERREILEIE